MDMKEIIRRIGTLRLEAKKSARTLSREIGKNAGYINRLESKNSFDLPISVLLEIIEALGSTPEEFFYENIEEYKTDKETLAFFKTLSVKQKKAIMNLYE